MSTFQSLVMVKPGRGPVDLAHHAFGDLHVLPGVAHRGRHLCGLASVSLDVGARPAQTALKRRSRFTFPVGEILSDLTQIIAERLHGVRTSVGHLENLEHRCRVPTAHIVRS
jgi:hypothetical protein